MTCDQSVESLLLDFYGSGNDMDLEGLRTSNAPAAACARLWLEDVEQTGQLALPRRVGPDVFWYVFGRSPKLTSDLREALLATAGPTHSSFRGSLDELDPSDPVEASVIGFLGSRMAFKIRAAGVAEGEVTMRGRRAQLAEALARVRKLGRQAPLREGRASAGLLPLLRDLRLALAAGSVAEGGHLVEQLATSRLLDAVNIGFLRVQMCAETCDWNALLALPDLKEIVASRRTRGVSRALLTAVYQVHFAQHEQRGDANRARAHFRELDMSTYAPLFRSRQGLNHPEAVKLFMLNAVAGTSPRPADTAELLAVPGLADADYRWLAALAGGTDMVSQREPQNEADRLTRAQAALDVQDFDRAYCLLAEAQPTKVVVLRLLDCADELRTPESRDLLMQAFHSLDQPSQLDIGRLHRWERFLAEEAWPTPDAPAPPTNWGEWLRACADQGTPASQLALLARRGGDEWDPRWLTEEPERLPLFEQALADVCAGSRLGILLDALPDLMLSLRLDPGFPSPAFRHTYATLAQCLSLDDRTRGRPEVQAFGVLCEALLSLGVDRAEYSDLLDGLELLSQSAGRNAASDVLDVLDVFLAFPCREQEGHRLEVGARILQGFGRWRELGQIDTLTLDAARVVACDLGLSAVLGTHEDHGEPTQNAGQTSTTPLASLTGVVGVYTLTRQVGARVQEALARLAPKCRIEVNSDHVATSALRGLAERADIFVVVAGSAKHAATDCIARCRSQVQKPVVYPDGRGVSSIVRKLVEVSTARA